MIGIRHLSLLIASLIIGWASWSIYLYSFDTTQPTISLSGLENDGWYSGEVPCSVAANKAGDLSVWLDGQPLINKYRLSKRAHEHPFIVPTKTINNGKHILKVELVDATFRKNKVTTECQFNVDNLPLQSAFTKADSDFKVFQGRTLHVQFQVNKEIKDAHVQALSKVYPCFPESKNSSIYESFIPIECEEVPNEYLFSIDIIDKVGNSLNLENKFQVVAFPFKKHVLQVSNDKVQEEKELGHDPKELKEILETLAKNSPQEKLWRGNFCDPIDIARVTCEFGIVRTTQERGRYQHKAVDVINQPKSVVWATQDGVVVLKDRYASSGNTIVVDHGFGILSLFFHLDSFADVKVGDKIAQGNPIGTIGKTGYATGYHLHWEMRINNVAVDPLQWTKSTF
jgi:murein DD-endopeptidase MepM/ murein hydrolase activator NlpD